MKQIIFITTIIIIFVGNLYAQVNLDSGLVAFWPFNGNANDGSGNGIHGTVFGATLSNDRFGIDSSAYSFDGLNDHIDFGASFQNLFVPFSISAWIFKTQHPRHEYIFTSNSQPNNYSGLYFSINQDTLLQISYGDGGTVASYSRRTKVSGTKIPLILWTHVVATVRGATDMTLYIDGTDVNGSYSGSGGNIINSNSISIMGKTKHNPDYWTGKIDNVRIYDRSLSNEEVQALYVLPPTSVDDTDNSLLVNFKLFQNYPNPFNPITKIKFSVSHQSFVTLKVYDGLGNEIETLVKKEKTVGSYQIEFDATRLPSGIYFYQLRVGSFVETKKMVLMK